MSLTRKDIETIIGDTIEDKDTLKKIVNDIVTKHSDTLDAVVKERDGLKDDLEARGKDLESLKKIAGDKEATDKALSELKLKYDADITAYEEKLTTSEIEKSLELAISDSKGRNPSVIKKLLDMDAVKNSKNRDVEIKSQISKLAEENSFLFNSEQDKTETVNTKVVNTGGDASGTSTAVSKEATTTMNDLIRGKIE